MPKPLALVPIPRGPVALVRSAPNPAPDLLIAAWLDAKSGRSGSAKTLAAYRETLRAFRALLGRHDLDLDGPTPELATLAQAFAGATHPSGRGRPARDGVVSPSTFNQRLAILSSFYTFAMRRGGLGANPIALCERRRVQAYAGARALDYKEVRERLARIDRNTPLGARDYALLAVLLQTGRRAGEVGGLLVADLLPRPGGALLVTFTRCKGDKQMRDLLPAPVAGAVVTWLRLAYGGDLPALPREAPVWISLSPNRSGGTPLRHKALSAICARRLGISTVHATRHTYARAMEDAGAKVSDIQGRLGHGSLATTGRYLAALRGAENEHAGAVAGLLGLES
jgi:integrase